MEYQNILKTIPHNTLYLNRYIKFIDMCILKNDKIGFSIFENHHILPQAKSLFPQYKSKTKYKWNVIKLTPRQHFICHYLLAKLFIKNTPAYHAMQKAFNLMRTNNKKTNTRYFNSKLYEYCKLGLSNSMKYTCSMRDENYINPFSKQEIKDKIKQRNLELYGVEYASMNKEIANKISNSHKGKIKSTTHRKNISNSHKGKVSAVNKITKVKLIISKEEFDNNRDIYEGITKGKMPCKDVNGNTVLVSKDDSRYMSGELVHNTTGNYKKINVYVKLLNQPELNFTTIQPMIEYLNISSSTYSRWQQKGLTDRTKIKNNIEYIKWEN